MTAPDDRSGVGTLLPDEPALVDAYAYPSLPGDYNYVRLSFVSSLDGAAEIGGSSRDLGGESDRRMVGLLRSLADVVLVGAQTVRSERYTQLRVAPDRQLRRRDAGQHPVPRVAVVSKSLDLDFDGSLFTHADMPPIVFTTEDAPAERAVVARRRAEVIVAGETRVESHTMLRALAATGLQRVLCEGGPSLAAALLDDGAADELCLTLSARLAGPGHTGIVSGSSWALPKNADLLHALRDGNDLFLRYRIAVV